MVEEIDADGDVRRFEYADNGKILKKFRNETLTETYTYRPDGRLAAKIRFSNGKKIETRYNALGKPDRTVCNGEILATTQYDAKGRPLAKQYAGGAQTHYFYNDDGSEYRLFYCPPGDHLKTRISKVIFGPDYMATVWEKDIDGNIHYYEKLEGIPQEIWDAHKTIDPKALEILKVFAEEIYKE